MALGQLPDQDLELECPRCKQGVTERFYGPCAACRAELGATLGNAPRNAVGTEYEPKMNVVPNAIASKD